jgi:DNA modification methylase/DNA-binding XRE family transcriptional regulator
MPSGSAVSTPDTRSLKVPEAPALPLMPFGDVLPPLSTEEFESLRISIESKGFSVEEHGQPVATEDGRLLDGYNRLKIYPAAPIHLLPGSAHWTDAECRAYILRHAADHRNMSPDQKNELRAKKKEVANALHTQDPLRFKQEILANLLGVSQPTIHSWIISNISADKANNGRSDARVRIPKNEHKAILTRYHAGETQAQLAADYGVTQGTISQIIKKAEKGASDRKLKKLKQQADKAPPSDRWHLHHLDCLAGMRKRVATGSVRLAFMDPPYNIGIDYGEGVDADRQPPEQYLSFLAACFAQLRPALTADGSLWVLIGDEYVAEVACLLKEAGFVFRNWIKWYETFGVNCTNKFNRTSRHLLYTVKDPADFVFNKQAVSRPSDRQVKYDDPRANPDGKLLDDVWLDIPRLAGTHSERLPEFPTQLPLALLTRVILCASDPDDLVLDPFAGSGTTGVAALQHDRCFVGFEKNARFAELAALRLKATVGTLFQSAEK